MDDVEITDNGTPLCWTQFKELVEKELWTGDDHSVLAMTPNLSSTRIVLAKKKSNGKFVGAVVWNEYDNVAWIGFYLLSPEARGKGIGSVIWKRAISRMPKGYTIGLRAVVEMAPKYQSCDTPISGSNLYAYKFPWRTLERTLTNHCEASTIKIKMVSSFTNNEWEKLFEFDRKVTKRDRKEFLKIFYGYDYTEGCVAIGEDDEILAIAGVTSTSLPGSHLFKLAPVYAHSLNLAASVIGPLAKWVGEKDEEGLCLFHILSDSKGEEDLLPMFKNTIVERKLCGLTLFSKEYDNPIDKNMLYVPHNNSGHMDA